MLNTKVMQQYLKNKQKRRQQQQKIVKYLSSQGSVTLSQCYFAAGT